jgi:hypothetical protein
MKPELKIIALIALMAFVLMPVQAMNITMANPSGISQRDIIVYDSAGQMYGFYNSTSVISLNGTEDYIFSMKPMQTNPLEDPGTWLTNDFIPLVTSNAAAIILMVFLAMLWLGRK